MATTRNRQSLASWIRNNRAELDAAIARAIGRDKNPRPNDAERRLWVLNDESLHRWARSEGVRL